METKIDSKIKILWNTAPNILYQGHKFLVCFIAETQQWNTADK